MKSANSEVIGSLFWVVFGALFLVGSFDLNVGTLRRPGPGFLPLIMAGLSVCLSLGVLVHGIAKGGPRLPRLPWKRHAAVISSIIGYSLLIEVVGFLLSSWVLMAILFGVFFDGESKWIKVTLYSGLTAASAWLVFVLGCQVHFPTPLIFRG